MSAVMPTMWALERRALDEIMHAARNNGEDASRVAQRAEMFAAQSKMARSSAQAKSAGRVGFIPIYGVLSQRGSWWSNTSTLQIQAELRALVNDTSVAAIVLDVDSPGGSVPGTQELSDAIFNARKVKPIIACCNSLCASAAYWAASAATKVFAAPQSDTGSIGVYCVHADVSKMNERLGLAVTYISAGRYKVEGNADSPLTPEAKAEFQRQVDAIYISFLSTVARNRGVSKTTVRADFGEGRTLSARDAINAGMVDSIQSLDQTISYAINYAAQQAAKQAASDAERRQRWAMMPGKVSQEKLAAAADLKARREQWAKIKAATGSDDPLVLLRSMWQVHNAVHFGGRLKQAEIRAADLTSLKAIACCRVNARPIKIEFDHKFLASASPQSLVDVLLHEQIHEHLAEQGHADAAGHGPSFAEVANKIGKFRGWPAVDPKSLNGPCAARLWPPRELKMKQGASHKVTV